VEAGDLEIKRKLEGCGKRNVSLYLGKEDTKHISLECLETNDWRMEMLCKRWSDINAEVAYRKMPRCTNKITVKNMEKFFIQSSM
jgi:hypothetical protein